MCASGLTDITAPLALAAGARGVGIGSMINKLRSQQQMRLAVTAIASSIGRNVNVDSQEIDVNVSAKYTSATSKVDANN